MKKYQENPQNQRRVTVWASRMSLGILISRVLGLLRDVLIAYFFSRTQTDVFFVAFRFPNFFRRFIGESSFSASVTPSITECLNSKSPETAHQLNAITCTFLWLLSSGLVTLGIWVMPELLDFLFTDSAYNLVPGKLNQTILVARIVFVYLFLVTTYSYLTSVAQALGKFFIPALAPAAFNVAMIVGTFLSSWKGWSFPALSLAWSCLVGGTLQALIVIVLLYKLKFLPKISINFKDPKFKSTMKRLFSSILALSGFAFIGMINLYFAGWLAEGSHTYIYYGDRLLELPRAIIAISLGTALMPALTRLFVLDKTKEFFKTINYYIGFVLFLILPCALVLYQIPEAIVSVLFERGEFKAADVIKVAQVVRIYAFVLIFSALSRVLSSLFFSMNKNWLCVLANAIYVCSHLAFAWVLTSNYGFAGLIWSTVLSSSVYFISLLVLLQVYIGSLEFKNLFFNFLKCFVSLIGMFMVLKSYGFVYEFLKDFTSLSKFISLFVICMVAGVVYLALTMLLKNPYSRDFLRVFNIKL